MSKIIDVSGLEFSTMPADQGQIVNYSYAVHPDGLLVCQRYDASNRSTSYTAAEIDEYSDVEFEPQNGQLPDCGEFEPIIEEGSELATMVEMLDRQGSIFAGNCTEDTAQDWIDNGFGTDDASEWCNVGCWDASTAAALRDAKLSPSDAEKAADMLRDEEEATWDAIDENAASDDDDWTPCDRDSEYTDGSPICAACNYDISVSVIIDAAKRAK